MDQEQELEPKVEEKEQELSVAKVPIGYHSLGFYFKVISLPVLVAVIVEIIYFYQQKNFDFVWLIDLIALGYLALIVIKKYHGKFQELAIACGISGLLIGFLSALFKLIYIRKFYLFLNLISETAITAISGIIIGLAIGYVFFNVLHLDKKDNLSSSSEQERR